MHTSSLPTSTACGQTNTGSTASAIRGRGSRKPKSKSPKPPGSNPKILMFSRPWETFTGWLPRQPWNPAAIPNPFSKPPSNHSGNRSVSREVMPGTTASASPFEGSPHGEAVMETTPDRISRRPRGHSGRRRRSIRPFLMPGPTSPGSGSTRPSGPTGTALTPPNSSKTPSPPSKGLWNARTAPSSTTTSAWRSAHSQDTAFSSDVVADTLLDQAEEALAVAAERRGYSSPWFNRGLMFLLQARIFETRGKDPTPALRQSVEAFQTGLELRPGVAGALTGLARAHFEIAQAAGELTGFTRAAQALDQSLEQDPTVAESWSLGALVTTFGPRKESTLVRDPIAAADRALEIDPTDPTVLKDCLLTCLELRRQNRREEDSAPLCDRTVSLSSDSLELRPNDTELRLLLRLLDGNSSSDPAGQSPIGELIEGNHRLRSRYGRFLGA